MTIIEADITRSSINPKYAISVYFNGDFYFSYEDKALPPCDCPKKVVLELFEMTGKPDLYGYRKEALTALESKEGNEQI